MEPYKTRDVIARRRDAMKKRMELEKLLKRSMRTALLESFAIAAIGVAFAFVIVEFI